MNMNTLFNVNKDYAILLTNEQITKCRELSRKGVMEYLNVCESHARKVKEAIRDGKLVEKNLPKKKRVTIPFIVTQHNMCFYVKGEMYSIEKTHPNYEQIGIALQGGDEDLVLNLTDIPKAVTKFMKGHVVVENGVVKYKDLEITGGMTKRIIDAVNEGDESRVDVLLAFFNNLMENTSNRVVNELFTFLEATDIELTDDGHFYAWKRVRSDYKDIYSGKFDNSIGQVVEVPRNMVDEDSTKTCSYGLHCASKGYIRHYGGCPNNRVVKVKVNPKDVVAVPADYQYSKMRTSKYEVVEDVTKMFLKNGWM